MLLLSGVNQPIEDNRLIISQMVISAKLDSGNGGRTRLFVDMNHNGRLPTSRDGDNDGGLY